MAITRPKSWEVIKAKPDAPDELNVGGRSFRFGDSGAFVTHDKAAAHEIEQQYGYEGGDRSVVVCEVDATAGRNPRRVFANPALPWKDD